MYTYLCIHTHIYTIPTATATGYPFGTLTNIGFQYFKEFGLQDFTLEDFPDLVLAPLLRRLATDISSLSYSHTPTLLAININGALSTTTPRELQCCASRQNKAEPVRQTVNNGQWNKHHVLCYGSLEATMTLLTVLLHLHQSTVTAQ